ncbi:MAG TPA: PEGA domain-containing protein [Vicinamibacterales bacterium]|nr:PEGA domain-containing protein [Vicinamibacterales bacterium]
MLHQIGVGALGPVFRTYEPTRDRLVAVKVFRLDIIPEQAQSLADELNRTAETGLFHPSIVEPIAAGVEGTVAYRAEEYVAAESLDVALRHYAPAPLEKVLPFITQLAGAIDFARAAGVGHGGLHPRDIFVTPDEARATGFGVVDALERAGIRAPIRRPYSAPERIAGEAWGTPADVFALAAIAYELLTGRRPAGIGADIGPLTGTVDGALEAIHAALVRAMDERPDRRYSSALAFAGALEAATRGTSAAASSSRTAEIPAVAPSAPAAAPSTMRDAELPTDERSRLDAPENAGDTEAASAERLTVRSLFDAEEEDRVIADENRMAMDDLPAEEAPAAPSYMDDFVDEPADRVFAASARDPEDAHVASYAPAAVAARDPFVDAERSRPMILPIAVTLVLGLLGGFAAGYFVGARNRTPAPAATQTQTEASAQPATPAGAQPFSDHDVSSARTSPPATSSGTATPPSEAPPVVPDAPGERSSAAAASAPSPAAPVRGRITVQSTPRGAGVTVNGRWRGRTPLTLEDLPLGRYVIRVVQSGYAVARDEFDLSARDATHTMSVRLEREAAPAPARPAAPPPRASSPAQPTVFTGTLNVDSRPQGARVLLDGTYVGRTPIRLPRVKVGAHVVRIELDEHKPWSAMTRVVAGEETRVTGSLERYR